MSKPRTAYQAFLAWRRPALQQEARDAGESFSLTESQARLKTEWDALDDERKRHFEEVARDERKRAMKEEEELDELHAQEQERRRHEKSALPSERSQRKSVMRDLAKAEKPAPKPKGPPKDPEARRRYEERQREKESRKRARASKEARLADARSRGKERRRAKTQRRAQYLLRQSDFFRDFVDKQGRVCAETPELQRSLSSPSKHAVAASADARAEAQDRTPKRGRKGKQGDDDEDEVDVVRLQSQPALIKNGEMRHYQLEGLNWMATLFANGINAILADEMGLGKTLQTISLLAHIKEREGVSGPHLIVVPKSTLGNWHSELRRWCPSLRPAVLQGSKAERAEFVEQNLADFDPNAPTFDVLITTYETVSIEKRHLQPITWCVLTVDEAHRLKNEKSVLATVVREYTVEMRLLLTGTPLQNNLHELWALLNFLMPDIFHSADAFDAEFNIHTDDDEEKRTVITKLHRILRPFMLRRLKSEVAKGLPPKSETMLYVGMSAMQRELYKNLLLKNKDAFSNTASKSSLANLVMQLRKACAHPYLFEGVEDRTLDPMGDHVITNCGKMVLLDKLMQRLHERGSRVLVFSQMTRVLDILEDFCRIREYDYSRIDGNTDSEERDSQIESFNAEGSKKFVFLLSTRAGGLGINLATADTVILYDSDWNPQMDLQAQDRAHRIGQKKHVHVFRLVTEDSVEERIVQSAQAKLRLDAVVIQQGRLADAAKRKVNKSDLMAAVQQGAKDIFRTQGSTITNKDIDAILTDGARRTKDMKDKLESTLPQSEKELMDFKMDATSTQVFEGVDYGQERKKAEREELRMLMTEQALAEADMMGRRERRAVAHYGKDGKEGGRGKKHKKKSIYPPHLQMPKLDPWHFFDTARLRELYTKAQAAYLEHIGPEAAAAGTVPKEAKEAVPPMLTAEEEKEKEDLLAAGFGHWTMREYHAFVNAVCVHGRDSLPRITRAVQDSAKKLWGRQPKTEQEVRLYADAFWRLGRTHLPDWDRIMRRMEEAAQRRREKKSLLEALDAFLFRYVNPWDQLRLQYAAGARHTKQGKHFTPQADRYLLCMIEHHGYGRWHAIRRALLSSPALRFDHFLRTRTPAELARRADVLLKQVEKEVSDCVQAEVRRAQRLRTGRREVVETAMGRPAALPAPNGSATSTPATGASSAATAKAVATPATAASASASATTGTPAHSAPFSRQDASIDPALAAAYKRVLMEHRVGKDSFTDAHRAALAQTVAETGEGGGASRVVDSFVDTYHTLTKNKAMSELRQLATFDSGKKAWTLKEDALWLLDQPAAPAPPPMPESARATIREYMAAKGRAAVAGKARMRQQRMTDFGGGGRVAPAPAPAPEQPPAKRPRSVPNTAVPIEAMPLFASILDAEGGSLSLPAMVELAVAQVPGISKRKAADAFKSIATHEGKKWHLTERGKELAVKAASDRAAAAPAATATASAPAAATERFAVSPASTTAVSPAPEPSAAAAADARG